MVKGINHRSQVLNIYFRFIKFVQRKLLVGFLILGVIGIGVSIPAFAYHPVAESYDYFLSTINNNGTWQVFIEGTGFTPNETIGIILLESNHYAGNGNVFDATDILVDSDGNFNIELTNTGEYEPLITGDYMISITNYVHEEPVFLNLGDLDFNDLIKYTINIDNILDERNISISGNTTQPLHEVLFLLHLKSEQTNYEWVEIQDDEIDYYHTNDLEFELNLPIRDRWIINNDIQLMVSIGYLGYHDEFIINMMCPQPIGIDEPKPEPCPAPPVALNGYIGGISEYTSMTSEDNRERSLVFITIKGASSSVDLELHNDNTYYGMSSPVSKGNADIIWEIVPPVTGTVFVLKTTDNTTTVTTTYFVNPFDAITGTHNGNNGNIINSIQTDKSEYSTGDLLKINISLGLVIVDYPITYRIIGPQADLVGIGQQNAESDITFEHMTGGNLWTESGEYTIQVFYLDTITETTITFEAEPTIDLYCGKPESYYDNVMRGTDGDDTLRGLKNSNDLILGFAGNDLITGMSGDDCIYGGDGDDLLRGANGDDIIYGGNGNDHIKTGNGHDMAYGEDGDDTLVAIGKKGSNMLDGGEGIDSCVGKSKKSIFTTINCE